VLSLASTAGETKGPPPHPQAMHDGSPAPGPFVVVAPRYGRSPYACFLTGIQSGVITVRMLGGEERQEVVSEIASIRFNPEDLPPPPHERMRDFGPGGPPPRDGGPRDGPPPPPGEGPPPRDNFRDGPPPKDGPRFGPRMQGGKPRLGDNVRRLKELQDKEQNEKLTDAELDELQRLRDEGPLFPPNTPRWWRVTTARSAARQAAKAGKLDAHIEAMRGRMQNAENVAEATDGLIMLSHAYIQRDGPVFTDIIRKIQTDIAGIRNERVRQDLKDNPPEMMEVLREQKANNPEPAKTPEPAKPGTRNVCYFFWHFAQNQVPR
jgi:hypothetical protein